MTWNLRAATGVSVALILSLTPLRADLSKQELAAVESLDFVTIPGPGEFFAAMARAGRPSWSTHVRSEAPAVTSSRTLMALTLGVLVADGYVAVEAQDGQAVKNIGKEILGLAKKLNVSQNVLSRSNSISDFADDSDWNALREELEATQNEVKLDMADQNDDRLVTLVTLGAWIRGVDIVSGMVASAYAPETARLLHQPSIARHLISWIDALPEGARGETPVPAMRQGLGDILPLVEPETPSAEQVAQLRDIMGGLVRAVLESKQ